MKPQTTAYLLAYNRHLLKDVQRLLTELPINAYTAPLPGYSQATVGKHIRHVLEFYECLISGLGNDGNVNYDARKRIPSYENRPEAAFEAIEVLISALEELAGQTSALTLTVNFDSSDERQIHRLNTSLPRELAYVYEHAVHHLALVRLALVLVAPDFSVPETLGVAPATLRSY